MHVSSICSTVSYRLSYATETSLTRTKHDGLPLAQRACALHLFLRHAPCKRIYLGVRGVGKRSGELAVCFVAYTVTLMRPKPTTALSSAQVSTVSFQGCQPRGIAVFGAVPDTKASFSQRISENAKKSKRYCIFKCNKFARSLGLTIHSHYAQRELGDIQISANHTHRTTTSEASVISSLSSAPLTWKWLVVRL